MPATGFSAPIFNASSKCFEVTLLELVQAICDETSNEREVVETVQHLLDSGRVRLCGNFRYFAPSTFR
jgi:hypothetical protein